MTDETRLAIRVRGYDIWHKTDAQRHDPYGFYPVGKSEFRNPLDVPKVPHLDWVLQESGEYTKMDLTAWFAGQWHRSEDWLPSWFKNVEYRWSQQDTHLFVLSWDWYEHARPVEPVGAISVWFHNHHIVAIEPHVGTIRKENFTHFPSLLKEMSKECRAYDLPKYNNGGIYSDQIYGLYFAARLLQQQYALIVREEWFVDALRLVKKMYAEGNQRLSDYAFGQLQFPDKDIQTLIIQEMKAANTLAKNVNRADATRHKHAELKAEYQAAIKAQAKQSEKRLSHLYVMKLGEALKIGISVDPERRRKELSVGPLEVELLTSTPLADARKAERYLHKALKKHKMRNEWFADCHEVRKGIRRFVPSLPVEKGY